MRRMAELAFQVELQWVGSGRDGAGRIVADDLELELSTPASMGGRGVGTNPEELLVCAVASCYSATLFRALERASLPVGSLRVAARGSVSGYPLQPRFERIVVSPTIVAGNAGGAHEYEQAAATARDHCFIGRMLAADVDYQLGAVAVEPAPVAPSAA